LGAGVTQLAPALVNCNGYGVGEVEAAAARTHRDHNAAVFRYGVPDSRWQPPGFRSEDQGVMTAEPALVRGLAVPGRKSEEPLGFFRLQKTFKIRMDLDCGKIGVIQASSAEFRFFQCEAKRLNEMKRTTCIGTQADDVARIGWNLRFMQHHPEKPKGFLIA